MRQLVGRPPLSSVTSFFRHTLWSDEGRGREMSWDGRNRNLLPCFSRLRRRRHGHLHPGGESAPGVAGRWTSVAVILFVSRHESRLVKHPWALPVAAWLGDEDLETPARGQRPRSTSPPLGPVARAIWWSAHHRLLHRLGPDPPPRNPHLGSDRCDASSLRCARSMGSAAGIIAPGQEARGRAAGRAVPLAHHIRWGPA
jgi:hypothetical protein